MDGQTNKWIDRQVDGWILILFKNDNMDEWILTLFKTYNRDGWTDGC